MHTRKLSVHDFILVFALLGMFPFPALAQRRAQTMDEYMDYERDFLHAFFPELSGKKYWITFETTDGYEPLDEGYENAGKTFLVDVGDGPKSQEIMCCIGGSAGGILGGTQQSTPAPAPPKPKSPNVGPHGELYPNQYLRAEFFFDHDGMFFSFGRLPSKPPEDKPDVWAELEQHPDISDADLVVAYKKSGARYALGDREGFRHGLAVETLEQFLGKLRIVKMHFLSTGYPRIDSLGGFSECQVYLKGPENKDYVAEFDGFSGQLLSVARIREQDKKLFYPDFDKDLP